MEAVALLGDSLQNIARTCRVSREPEAFRTSISHREHCIVAVLQHEDVAIREHILLHEPVIHLRECMLQDEIEQH